MAEVPDFERLGDHVGGEKATSGFVPLRGVVERERADADTKFAARLWNDHGETVSGGVVWDTGSHTTVQPLVKGSESSITGRVRAARERDAE